MATAGTRRSKQHVQTVGEDEQSEHHEEVSDQEDGIVRKRQKLNSDRPLCTNCEQCQIRKGKCDRNRPRCGWCITNDRVCEYLEKKKPGLRAGYGRDLERRLFRVEELIQKHSQLLNDIAQLKDSPANQHRSQIAASGSKQSLQHDSPHSGTDLKTAVISPFLPQLDSPQTVANILHSGSGIPKGTSSFGAAAPINSRVQAGDSSELPPYDLLSSLVDLYFTHVNTWCPILERKSTLQVLFGTHALEEGDQIILHAMIAVTLRFCTDVRLTEQTRKLYYNASKQRVLLYGIENSSVKGLQAMVILALDLHGSASIGGGLKMIALIARSAIQLGLNTESSSPVLSPDYPSISTLRASVLPEPRDWIEDESRRRLFWMIYLLDRDATVATAFDYALNENDIDRKLPCSEDLFGGNRTVPTRWFPTLNRTDYSMNNHENLGPFSYQVEIKALISHVHQFLKRPMDVGVSADVSTWQARYRELDGQIRNWQMKLPSDYNIGRLDSTSDDQRSSMSPGWILLQASYFFALIRLHSSAAYPAYKSPIFGPSFAASQHCYSAVESIVTLARSAVQNDILHQLGVTFAFTLWVGARVLLVHGSTIEKSVNPGIYFLISTLERIGKYWPLANRYTTILSRVMEEYQESQARVVIDGRTETPASVTILADMRRTALDLEVLISQAPRLQPPVVNQNRIEVPSEIEQQYLEAFDFFNYPRLPNADILVEPTYQRLDMDQFGNNNYSIDMSSDWLAGTLP